MTDNSFPGDPWGGDRYPEPLDDAEASYFDASAYDDAPREPSASERAGGAAVKTTAPTQAAELIGMARARYGMVRCTDGGVYAVEHERPGIALELRGSAGIRQQIAKVYYDEKGKAAGQAALTDMLNVLEGDAMEADEVAVYLRFAGPVDGAVFIDLGTPDGRALRVAGSGWGIVANSPVLFRRSALIAEIPAPVEGGSLDGLRSLVNVQDGGFRLLVGWLVAGMLADMPRPILALFGQQGTAKTTAMRMLKMLIDPSPAPTMSPPRSDEDWQVAAYQSPVVALDNLSHMVPWFQDALCKAVTGDGVMRRERYTDKGVSVMQFKRAIALTSIDPGALQGDVAERLLTVELEPIKPTERRTDAEVSARFDAARREALGALLDLLSGVLGILPGVVLDEMPRMADFARVLAAVDKLTGWTTLDDYLSAGRDTTLTVIENSEFTSAVRDFVETQRAWVGTMADLLEQIEPGKPSKTWPKSPAAASGRLKRDTPALLVAGIVVETPPRAGHAGRRVVALRRADAVACFDCGGPLNQAMADKGMIRHPTCEEPAA